MEAFDLLIDDHRRIQNLVRRLMTETSSPARRHLLAELQRELELDAVIERDLLYPKLGGDKLNSWRAQAEQNRSEIEHACAALETTPLESPDWREALRRLRDAYDHHVDMEEEDIFPEARRVLSGGDQRLLAERMKEERDGLIGIRGDVEDLMPRDWRDTL